MVLNMGKGFEPGVAPFQTKFEYIPEPELSVEDKTNQQNIS